MNGREDGGNTQYHSFTTGRYLSGVIDRYEGFNSCHGDRDMHATLTKPRAETVKRTKKWCGQQHICLKAVFLSTRSYPSWSRSCPFLSQPLGWLQSQPICYSNHQLLMPRSGTTCLILTLLLKWEFLRTLYPCRLIQVAILLILILHIAKSQAQIPSQPLHQPKRARK